MEIKTQGPHLPHLPLSLDSPVAQVKSGEPRDKGEEGVWVWELVIHFVGGIAHLSLAPTV